MLRLALVGPRSLAARAPGAPVPRRALRARRASDAGAEPRSAGHRRRGALPRGQGPRLVRAPVRPRLAAPTGDGDARVARSRGPGLVARTRPAGSRRRGPARGMAAQARVSDPRGRALPDRFRLRPGARLGAAQRRRRAGGTPGVALPRVLREGPRLPAGL